MPAARGSRGCGVHEAVTVRRDGFWFFGGPVCFAGAARWRWRRLRADGCRPPREATARDRMR
ncbi:hypothetical protein C7S17_0599 [Burkholderia thailandensis]|nr:hypothetical protein [Burkholderia thailandensis]